MQRRRSTAAMSTASAASQPPDTNAAAAAAAFEARWSRFYSAGASDSHHPVASKSTPVGAATTAAAPCSNSNCSGGEDSDAGDTSPGAVDAGASAEVMEAKLDALLRRLAEKKEVMEERALRQLRAEGDELERWHRYHVDIKAQQQQREAEEATRRHEDELRREQFERENAERLHIERSTAHLTPRSKARWIEDNNELLELESKLATHEGKMSSLNSHIGSLVAEYEHRLEREAEEQRREAEAQEQLQRQHEESLAQERRGVEDSHIESAMLVFADWSDTLWGPVREAHVAGREDALSRARARIVSTISPYDLSRLDAAASDAARNEILDELVEVDVLRQTLKKQLSRR